MASQQQRPHVRQVALSEPVILMSQGNMFQSALAIADVDNDEHGDAELVVGTTEGSVLVFKGLGQTTPWRVCQGLGMISCVAIGDARNVGQNALLAVTAEGVLYVFDVHADDDDGMSSMLLQPTSVHSVPTNVTALLLATHGSGSTNYIFMGTSERHLHAFQLQRATENRATKPDTLTHLWGRHVYGQVRSLSATTQPGSGSVLLVGLESGAFVVVDSALHRVRYRAPTAVGTGLGSSAAYKPRTTAQRKQDMLESAASRGTTLVVGGLRMDPGPSSRTHYRRHRLRLQPKRVHSSPGMRRPRDNLIKHNLALGTHSADSVSDVTSRDSMSDGVPAAGAADMEGIVEGPVPQHLGGGLRRIPSKVRSLKSPTRSADDDDVGSHSTGTSEPVGSAAATIAAVSSARPNSASTDSANVGAGAGAGAAAGAGAGAGAGASAAVLGHSPRIPDAPQLVRRTTAADKAAATDAAATEPKPATGEPLTSVFAVGSVAGHVVMWEKFGNEEESLGKCLIAKKLGSQLCTMQRAPLCGGDGSEDMLVVCGWDGNTVMIDRRGNSVRFELGQYIRAFAIADDRILVYPNLPAAVPTLRRPLLAPALAVTPVSTAMPEPTASSAAASAAASISSDTGSGRSKRRTGVVVPPGSQLERVLAAVEPSAVVSSSRRRRSSTIASDDTASASQASTPPGGATLQTLPPAPPPPVVAKASIAAALRAAAYVRARQPLYEAYRQHLLARVAATMAPHEDAEDTAGEVGGEFALPAVGGDTLDLV